MRIIYRAEPNPPPPFPEKEGRERTSGILSHPEPRRTRHSQSPPSFSGKGVGGLGFFCLFLAALPAAESTRPLSPTPVTWEKHGAFLGEVPDAFPKQAGATVTIEPRAQKTKFNAAFKNEPFWTALQATADQTEMRLTLSNGGRKVELVPRGKSRESAATSGAFRIVTQQVTGRALLAEGITVHEVQLLVHWEPRVRVYRIDTTPAISKITDVPGSKLTAEGGGSRILPSDATSEMRVKISGLTRDSEKLTALAGTFSATAADRMLTFEFEAPGGKLPDRKSQGGVSAALKRVQKKDDSWEIAIEITYPEGQPVFESFQGEWWLRDNRLTLRAPNGKLFVIDDYEIPDRDNSPSLVVVHRFKEDPMKGPGNPTAKGWKIVYETPSPLAEVKVPFELKDIPLP